MAAVTHALGYASVHELNRDDLVALTPEAAQITGLAYALEYHDTGGVGVTSVYDLGRIALPPTPAEYEDHTARAH